jgi:hypothetical protein
MQEKSRSRLRLTLLEILELSPIHRKKEANLLRKKNYETYILQLPWELKIMKIKKL